jgi:hypothetical protein
LSGVGLLTARNLDGSGLSVIVTLAGARVKERPSISILSISNMNKKWSPGIIRTR